MNPNIHIIVNTKYLRNIDEVIDAGADEVVPKEFETSILMFTRIMDYYKKDADEIADAVNNLRSYKCPLYSLNHCQKKRKFNK